MSLLIVVLVILLPILPAFLLFWALPSTAMLSGPLQGFKVNLGGAFAGYFAVVVLLIASHKILFPPPPVYQVWELSGTITDENGIPFQPLGATDVAFDPPNPTDDKDGFFTVRFTTTLDAGGKMTFPKIFVSHDGYNQLPIELNSSERAGALQGMQVDPKGHTITIPRIRLLPLPPLPPGGNHAAAEVLPAAKQSPSLVASNPRSHP